MALSAMLCWLSWGLTLINIDPTTGRAWGFAFFYFSLFLALGGTGSLLLFYIYQRRWNNDLPLFAYVSKSFREAFIVAGFLTLTLFLLGQQWLTVWTGSLLLTLFILVISLFWSLSPKSKVNHSNFL